MTLSLSSGAEAAAEWVFAHMEDSDFNDPLPPPTAVTDAAAPTAQELEEGVTKLRYMQFREMMSSSSDFGWRIEGIELPGKKPAPGTLGDIKTMKELGALKQALLDAGEEGKNITCSESS